MRWTNKGIIAVCYLCGEDANTFHGTLITLEWLSFHLNSFTIKNTEIFNISERLLEILDTQFICAECNIKPFKTEEDIKLILFKHEMGFM